MLPISRLGILEMFCDVIIFLGASNWSITYIRIYTEKSECHVIAGPFSMQNGVLDFKGLSPPPETRIHNLNS
jgi:hypothetical protein